MKRQLSATLPDGTIVTRTTARNYTHVVAHEYYTGEKWIVNHWCGSLELAQKQVDGKGRIIPVNQE